MPPRASQEPLRIECPLPVAIVGDQVLVRLTAVGLRLLVRRRAPGADGASASRPAQVATRPPVMRGSNGLRRQPVASGPPRPAWAGGWSLAGWHAPARRLRLNQIDGPSVDLCSQVIPEAPCTSISAGLTAAVRRASEGGQVARPCRWGRPRAPTVRQDQRAPFPAGLRRARETAYPEGEYVGQESFLRAAEIRRLARPAGIGPGAPVLDLCCGMAGPGRLVVAEPGCRYSGWTPPRAPWRSHGTWPATCRAASSRRRFRRCRTAPSTSCSSWRRCWPFPTRGPSWPTWSACSSPEAALRSPSRRAPPLTPSERARMPDADTVWLIELAEMGVLLREVGLTVTWQEQWSASPITRLRRPCSSVPGRRGRHRPADRAGRPDRADRGARAVERLAGPRAVRKFGLVAEKR